MPTQTTGTPSLSKPHPARHLFSTWGIIFVTLFILGVFALTAYVARDLIRSGSLAAVVTSTLVDLANKDRSAEDLGNLTINPLLVAAAQAKADDMAEKGYFAHNSPEGKTSWVWFKEVGYSFTYAGENLAVNFSDSEDVERAWMDSPTHRANIMNGKFTEIGIATAVGEYEGKKTLFVVQMFGTPRATATTPRPLTSSDDPDSIAIATTEGEDVAEVPLPVEPVGQVEAPVPTEATVLAETGDSITRYANPLETLIASPQELLRSIYVVVAFLILVALAFVTRLELQHHHLRHFVAASFFIVLMTGLFAFAGTYLFTDPILLTEAVAPIEEAL